MIFLISNVATFSGVLQSHYERFAELFGPIGTFIENGDAVEECGEILAREMYGINQVWLNLKRPAACLPGCTCRWKGTF